tara:strand:+ start:13231 stop:13446 length:216 start_codon:yes stop_codon:yes gene_type:complete
LVALYEEPFYGRKSSVKKRDAKVSASTLGKKDSMLGYALDIEPTQIRPTRMTISESVIHAIAIDRTCDNEL